jgi:release factor glutamine methyltransferase
MSEMTVRGAYMRASSFLVARGVEDHVASVEWLLQHVLGVTRTRLLTQWSEPMDEDQHAKLWELINRRALGEPVQYITGETYFYGRKYLVNRSVLIPRPETELLVERILATSDKLWEPESSLTIVDVGTGSGAIAISLALERSHWKMIATDISVPALNVAKQNANRHQVSERIQFLERDLLVVPNEATDEESIGAIDKIDILVSNPPYIRTRDLPDLQREVRNYEPHLALDGGEEGLDLYDGLLKQLRQQSVWPRFIALEVGLGQAQQVEKLLRETGKWDHYEIIPDLAGVERNVFAWTE